MDSLNWEYINEQIELLGMKRFEQENRELALRLFRGEPIDHNEMLDYMLEAGVHGNIGNLVDNGIHKQGGKTKYIMSRLFIPMKAVEKGFPFFYRHKVLLPLLPFYRLWVLRKKGYSRLMAELSILKKRKR